jgi:hypothetical protein
MIVWRYPTRTFIARATTSTQVSSDTAAWTIMTGFALVLTEICRWH